MKPANYIFSSKSQCKVAEKYTKFLVNGGEKKTIEQIRSEFDISNARAKGAKAFGEIGSDNIWFILIPVEKLEIIHDLENELIEAGFEWNRQNGFPPLINKVRPNK